MDVGCTLEGDLDIVMKVGEQIAKRLAAAVSEVEQRPGVVDPDPCRASSGLFCLGGDPGGYSSPHVSAEERPAEYLACWPYPGSEYLDFALTMGNQPGSAVGRGVLTGNRSGRSRRRGQCRGVCRAPGTAVRRSGRVLGSEACCATPRYTPRLHGTRGRGNFPPGEYCEGGSLKATAQVIELRCDLVSPVVDRAGLFQKLTTSRRSCDES